MITNRIELDPVGSHNPINGALVQQFGVQTEFRFCQNGWFVGTPGTFVVDSVVALPTGLDLQGPVPNTIFGYGPMSQTLSGISPRVGFVPVFSRLLGALFIVGGRANPSSPDLGEIWMVKDGANPVQIQVPGYTPMHVTAATIGSADKMLWIRDEGLSPCQTYPMARLVRINLQTLEHEVIAEGMRYPYFNKHWLTVDRDGHVLFVASSQAWDVHVTIRIEADPFQMNTAAPTALQHGVGTLMSAPLVDADGYFYVTQDAQGMMDSLRVPGLDPPSPNGIHLGSFL